VYNTNKSIIKMKVL